MPEPPPSPAAATRAASAIWIALAALALARALCAFAPSMWPWGLDAQRLLAPLPGWTLWTLGTLALLPFFSRPLLPWLARLGEMIEGAPLASTLLWAAGAGLLAWLLPDRLHFVGDFQVRLSALESEYISIGAWSHGALPLELLIHEKFVHLIRTSLTVDWLTAMRVLGVIEAALLGALAVQFARVLRLRGAPAAAASAIVLFGGYLTLFTGYDKAFTEVALAAVAIGIFGIAAARDGRGLLPLGLAAAVAFASHRSAIGLLIPLLVAWFMAWRARGGGSAWRRPDSIAALLIPIATLAALAPGMLAAMKQFDAPHFSPPGARHGVLGALLAPRHLLDVANLVVVLSPLAIAAPTLLIADRDWRRRETLLLLALLAPCAGMLLLVHSHQGLFRDLDVFAVSGLALSLLAAWLVGHALEAAPARAWLAVAVTLNVAAPALQWMLLPADLERGLARVRAFVEEAPRRSDTERAETWDFLGIRLMKLERWSEAAQALGHAAETAPSPRILKQWAICEARLGNLEKAHALYGRSLQGAPADFYKWREYAASSMLLHRYDDARRAAGEMLRITPGDPDALRILDDLARIQRADSTGGR